MTLFRRKIRKLSTQFMNLKYILSDRGFSKFKRNYRLLGELGRGGFGIVYSAIRVEDETPVAVKFIDRKTVRDWAKIEDERVPLEIAILARCIEIGGVIRLFDWYNLPEGFLIVMERPYPSIDLFDLIKSQSRLDEECARFLFRQIAQTIMQCIELNILHRDLKDENIIVDLISGETKLIDFGAAIFLNKNTHTDFQGTRLYCPPEWFLHSVYLGKEAAVWSLGILLYNMLNGRLPFRDEKDICTSHLLGPLSFFAPLSPEARDLIQKCLRFDPSTRYTLEQILSHQWTRVPSPDWLTIYSNQEESNSYQYCVTSYTKEKEAKRECRSHIESGVGTSSNMSSPAFSASNSKLDMRINENTIVSKQRLVKTSLIGPCTNRKLAVAVRSERHCGHFPSKTMSSNHTIFKLNFIPS